MKLAVVGHVEWVDFVLVDRLPAPGEIVEACDAWEAPAGGGAMAAFALRSLTGAATFFCAVGRDGRGFATLEELRDGGLEVLAAMRGDRDQRRTLSYLTADGERTITQLGAPLVPHGDDDLPWSKLEDYDGVLFFAGDAAAARACRAAKVMVSTGRARAALLEAGVQVDALVGSVDDVDERIDDELLMASRPRWVVQTEGERGGVWYGPGTEGTAGRWAATPLPIAPVDAFGCGDAFAAALMAGLADGRSIADACALGARVGAALLCQRAPAVGELAQLWGAGALAQPRAPEHPAPGASRPAVCRRRCVRCSLLFTPWVGLRRAACAQPWWGDARPLSRVCAAAGAGGARRLRLVLARW